MHVGGRLSETMQVQKESQALVYNIHSAYLKEVEGRAEVTRW